MEFFLDTANIQEIKEAAQTGMINGVTTNPSLISKEGRPFADVVKEICSVVDGPISAEVIATDYEGMIKEGRDLAKIHSNVTIKVPLTVDGLRACQVFRKDNIKVNVTLCFSAAQALLAAKAGATFISPFIGRLDDVSEDGIKLIEDIRSIYDNYNFPTKILAASIRHPMHVVNASLAGADVATMPLSVLKMLFQHPLTDKGIAKFLDDWKKLKT